MRPIRATPRRRRLQRLGDRRSARALAARRSPQNSCRTQAPPPSAVARLAPVKVRSNAAASGVVMVFQTAGSDDRSSRLNGLHGTDCGFDLFDWNCAGTQHEPGFPRIARSSTRSPTSSHRRREYNRRDRRASLGRVPRRRTETPKCVRARSRERRTNRCKQRARHRMRRHANRDGFEP